MGKVKIDVGIRVCYKACKGMGMSEGECLEHAYGYLTRVLDYSYAKDLTFDSYIEEVDGIPLQRR